MTLIEESRAKPMLCYECVCVCVLQGTDFSLLWYNWRHWLSPATAVLLYADVQPFGGCICTGFHLWCVYMWCMHARTHTYVFLLVFFMPVWSPEVDSEHCSFFAFHLTFVTQDLLVKLEPAALARLTRQRVLGICTFATFSTGLGCVGPGPALSCMLEIQNQGLVFAW